MINIVFWCLFGFLSSWIAAIMLDLPGSRYLRAISLGLGGAMAGGFSTLYILHGTVRVTGYSPASIVGAVIGSLVCVGLLGRFASSQLHP